jgi:hypothetical protein
VLADEVKRTAETLLEEETAPAARALVLSAVRNIVVVLWKLITRWSRFHSDRWRQRSGERRSVAVVVVKSASFGQSRKKELSGLGTGSLVIGRRLHDPNCCTSPSSWLRAMHRLQEYRGS